MTPAPLAQLTLLWLACKPEHAGKTSDLRRAVARTAEVSGQEVMATVAGLAQASLVTDAKGRLQLTSDGRAEAARAIGLDDLPDGLRWDKVLATLLPARILGTPVRGRDASGALRAAILRVHEGVKVPEDASLGRVSDAVAWKLVGIASDRPFTRKNVLAALLEPALGGPLRDPGRAIDLLAAKHVGARKPDAAALRTALRRSWLARPQAGALADWAARVRAAARAATTGRFGDNKVFISHVWRALGDGEPLDAFKARLLEAHREGLLALSRADLVPAMDPKDVAESEIAHLSSTFHFLRLEEEPA